MNLNMFLYNNPFGWLDILGREPFVLPLPAGTPDFDPAAPVEYMPSTDDKIKNNKHISKLPTITTQIKLETDQNCNDDYSILTLVWSKMHAVIYRGCCYYQGIAVTKGVTRSIHLLLKRPSSGDCSDGPKNISIQMDAAPPYTIKIIQGGISVNANPFPDSNIYDFCSAEGSYYPYPSIIK